MPLLDLGLGICAVALVEPGDACGQELPVSVSRVPSPSGSKVYSQCTQPLLTCHANFRPGSAATTWLRVSHVRSGVSLRPVNQAPTCGPAPSSHQQALQIGLHSPVLVTSDTSAYSSSGGTATEIESDNFNSVTSSSVPPRGYCAFGVSVKLERVPPPSKGQPDEQQ